MNRSVETSNGSRRFLQRSMQAMALQIKPRCVTVLLLALTACGGEPEPGISPLEVKPVAGQRDAPVPAVAAGAMAVTSEPVPPPMPASPAPRLAKKSDEPATYELRIFKTRGVYGEIGTMTPVRGAGYEPLIISVQMRNRPRHLSAVAGVQPYCPTTTRCEYLPPRKGHGPEKLTVSLNEGSIAQLSPAKDMIALTVRQLEVSRPVTVTITLTVPGQEPVVRRIVYAQAEQGADAFARQGGR